MVYNIYFEPYLLKIGDAELQGHSLADDIYDGSSAGIKLFINEWLAGSSKKDIAIISNEPDKVCKRVCKMFTRIYAAGGLVVNSKSELLMIHRLGKWDLPKGKIDAGEDARTAAVREVTEETGVGRLNITRFLTNTWHLYKDKHARWLLKETAWFVMHTDYAGDLRPQADENILEAAWVDADRIRVIAPESYRSIFDLIQLFQQAEVGTK